MAFHKYGRNIAEFVKKYREDHDLTQQQLADQLGGFHAQYVSNIERGLNKRPVKFCYYMLEVIEDKRAKYLVDLLHRSVMDGVSNRLHG
jgi:transcriptional regulator with XRE-family HTH domain